MASVKVGASLSWMLVDMLNLRRTERFLRGDDHELLEGKTATSVGATVEDVHEGNGEDVGLLGASKVGDVSVQRNTLGVQLAGNSTWHRRRLYAHLLSSTGLGNGQRDTQDGVGAKLGLVGGTVELVEEGIDSGLVLDIKVLLNQSGSDDRVDVLDSLGDTLATPLGLVTISELAGLVLT